MVTFLTNGIVSEKVHVPYVMKLPPLLKNINLKLEIISMCMFVSCYSGYSYVHGDASISKSTKSGNLLWIDVTDPDVHITLLPERVNKHVPNTETMRV